MRKNVCSYTAIGMFLPEESEKYSINIFFISHIILLSSQGVRATHLDREMFGEEHSNNLVKI